MPQLFCVLEESGKALLIKAQGDIQTPSFPTVGLLCSIATYSDNAGFTLHSCGGSNVRIVYTRFCNNQLLFVLATSSLLVHTDLLQLLLKNVYSALLLLLGPTALVLDSTAKVDMLRKRLRGLPVIGSLVADDALAPCLLLSVPQISGLSLRDKASLRATLLRIAAAANTQYAALLGEGHYLSATPAWWRLQPQEALVLQHLGAHMATAVPQELPLYPAGLGSTPMKLVMWTLEEGTVVLLIIDLDSDVTGLEPQLHKHFAGIQHILEVPVWCSAPIPQFASIMFDAAMVMDGSSHCASLLWGRSSCTLQSFNPLMSPTLRKQLAAGASPGRGTSRSTAGSTAAGAAGEVGTDNMQLFYKAMVDMLVAFMLQCSSYPLDGPGLLQSQHIRQLARAHQAESSNIGTAVIDSDCNYGAVRGDAQEASGALEELHAVLEGNRLVALIDSCTHPISVFVALTKTMSRQQALEAAVTLRAVYSMVYSSDAEG